MKYINTLAFGELFKNISKSMLLLIFSGVLYDKTGEIWAVGIVISSEMIISLFVPFLAGIAINKYGASLVLILASLITSLTSLLAFMNIDYFESIYLYICLSFVLSIGSPFIRNSVFCITPVLAKHFLTQANSRLTVMMQVGQFIGMGVAALIFKFELSTSIAFLFASLGYFISFIFYLISTNNIDVNTGYSKNKKLFSYRINSNVNNILLSVLIFLSCFEVVYIVIFNLLLAPVVDFSFNNDKEWMSYLDALFAVGATFGGIYTARVKNISIVTVFFSQMSFFSLMVSYLFLEQIPIILFCFFWGLCLSASGVYWDSLLQNCVPTEELSNLSAIRGTLSSILGLTVSYIVADVFSISFSYAVFVSIGITIISFLALIYVVYRSRLNGSLMELSVG
ncbi:MFS transporter [Vibrio coralliilyticus]|uniref:MFS transporter n=1 Tax=Vibrio coralliilyticus TaxID=190893 RepID=UPI00156129FB|nr:MFS transporter [Vibrio coralliilyticus]NRF25486.1 MFS transporter [Vibrio coralliilyticus]NRF79451.1 MFS transporter [Vibrio coralliilyticus]